MTRVVDAYNVLPQDIESGDIMMFVIKAMVTRPGLYRIYRCRYEGSEVPQGPRILNEEKVCEQLFPSLAAVAKVDY